MTRSFTPVRIAILTISDSRNLDTDTSGALLAERAGKAGHSVTHRAVVTDDLPAIRNAVEDVLGRGDSDVVITTGGTGLTGRDVTIEALRPLFDKEITGFAVAFQMVSWRKIGTSTVQSRATAGVVGGVYMFCLPGSPGACRDAWDEILASQLDSRHKPCNFVQIMPRLTESLAKDA